MESKMNTQARQENIDISNRSFGTKVLGGRRYGSAKNTNVDFKLKQIRIEDAQRARLSKDFQTMQDPANKRIIVFKNEHDYLIEDFLGIYAPASPDCVYPDKNSPVLEYFFAEARIS